MLTNLKQTKTVIVGFGRFGRLLHKILTREGMDIVVVENHKISESGVVRLSMQQAVQDAGLIILCIPISEFEECIQEISRNLENRAGGKLPVVVDVCSVKTHPAKIMLDNLPGDVGIISTHPLWGPHSSEDGNALVGLKFFFKVLRDNGSPIIHEFIQLWGDLGQELIEVTPEQHDRKIAYSQAFAFLVGEIGIELNVHEDDMSTKGLLGILHNQNIVSQESNHLFRDMFRYNPFAREMLEKFISTAQELKQELIINI